MEDVLACELCGKDYLVSDSTADYDKTMYCSVSCEEDYANARD